MTRKRWLTTIQIPVSMSSMDKNTAESQVSVIQTFLRRIPELNAFQQEFSTQCRVAVVDRFGANGRREGFLESHDTQEHHYSLWLRSSGSWPFQRALAVEDNTVSGGVNIGLLSEGAGTLQTLRSIVQDIFRTDLAAVFDEAPGGRIIRHRTAILDLFLPITTGG